MTFCLDDVLILLGEIGCWSLVRLEALYVVVTLWFLHEEYLGLQNKISLWRTTCKEASMLQRNQSKNGVKKSIRMTTVEPRFNEGQGNGQIRSLKPGFIILRFFSIHFTKTGAENIVCYIKDFINVYNGSLYWGYQHYRVRKIFKQK